MFGTDCTAMRLTYRSTERNVQDLHPPTYPKERNVAFQRRTDESKFVLLDWNVEPSGKTA